MAAYGFECLDDLVELDDGGMAEAAQHLHLVVDADSFLAREFVLVVDFDCDFALVGEVDAAADQSVSPSSQIAVELYVGKQLLHELPLLLL